MKSKLLKIFKRKSNKQASEHPSSDQPFIIHGFAFLYLHRKKLLIVASSLVAVGLVFLAIAHFSPLKWRMDPAARTLEKVRVSFASGDVEKAHAHLSIAEARLRDYTALSKKDSSSPYLGKIAGDMVYNDKQAMQYMDNAKEAGRDIKKLKLVERLCDSLGLQSRELKLTNFQINEMHAFASFLENRVNTGMDIASAMNEVEKALSAAMSW